MLKSTVPKIHAAAIYFARVSRELEEIASIFDLSTHTIRKWAKTSEWTNALDAIGYTGDLNFASEPKRDAMRETPELIEKAKQVYQDAIRSGTPRHKWATLAGDEVGLSRRRIHDWAMRYKWREGVDLTGGIMLLSENRSVIDALKIILEDYPYLKYNEQRSEGEDYLYVEVTDRTARRDEDVIHRIHSRLRQTTGERFISPPIVGHGHGHGHGSWSFFRIRKL